MRGALGGPRVLLRRLREVMAEPVSAQERLNKIVVLIAANMVAEVCSLYVLRVDGTLELYASRRPEPRVRARHRAAPGRGPGRPGVERGEIAQPLRRAAPSGLLVPPRDRRRNLPLVPRRPDPARRQYARRAGGAEPRAPHLFGGGRGGAADHRDGARRDHRVGRTLRARQARPRAGRAPAAAARRPVDLRRHRARPRRAARAARDRHQADRRRSAEGIAAPRCGAQHAARRPRRDAGAARRRRRAASTARCSKPTACSPTTAAGCTRCTRR